MKMHQVKLAAQLAEERDALQGYGHTVHKTYSGQPDSESKPYGTLNWQGETLHFFRFTKDEMTNLIKVRLDRVEGKLKELGVDVP